jgi:hypothetical protein
VPQYAKVRYQAVYPGVDLIYYGSQRQLEWHCPFRAAAPPAVTGARG